MDYIDEQASKNINEMQNNTQALQDQQINPATNPFSNGTGSARSVFDPVAQNSINSVNQGQNMGDMMFNNNQGPSITIARGGSGGAGNLLTKLGPLAATAAGVVGVAKMVANKKEQKEESKASSKENPSVEVDKPKKGLFKRKNKEVKPSGASMNGGPGGRKKPTANTMKSESTGVAKPKGWGHEQLKTDAVTDHVLGMRDMGFYSNKYAMDRISGKMGYPASTYETVRHPGAKSTAVEKTIAKGPKKPQAKPQSEMKMLRSVKGIEPKKKLMATKTKAKAKTPLKKMTPRPAKKL